MPSVRILDNMQLEANAYVIKIKEIEAGQGQIFAGQYMVMDPMGGRCSCPASTRSSRPSACRRPGSSRRCATRPQLRGYTVVDAATVLSTHLTEILKANMADLLSYAEVQKLLKELPKEQAKLVKDIVPSQISVTGIQRVLQLLLAERVSIRDLPRSSKASPRSSAHPQPARHRRARARAPARQICAANIGAGGNLPIITLSPRWESAFAEVDRRRGRRPPPRHAALAADRVRARRARRASRTRRALGEMPVLVTSAAIRPFVRSIIERFRAADAGDEPGEIHPRARLRTVGSV